MEYEILTKNGETFFAYGVAELKATIKDLDVKVIWKNIKYNGTNEDVTSKYVGR